MKRVELGPQTFLYPVPIVLAGADVEGKPNFVTVGNCGVVNYSPAMIGIALGRNHYTNAGIKESMSFSINTPSEDMAGVADYCGIYSGRKVDKSNLFDVFYGELGNAPMIAECPLSLECRLMQVLDMGGTNEFFIGRVIQAYASDSCLSGGNPDLSRLRPILFSTADGHYWGVGERLGKAWSIGREYGKPS